MTSMEIEVSRSMSAKIQLLNMLEFSAFKHSAL